jgi:uncharacterized protein YecE (DUF72 family)
VGPFGRFGAGRICLSEGGFFGEVFEPRRRLAALFTVALPTALTARADSSNQRPMNHWVGTSGFQYPEWKAKFYPADLSASKMLPFYAGVFNSTEINYSFRRIPSNEALARWDEATPGKFKFSFKAPQRITHFARLNNCEETMNYFAEGISNMGRKLGPVLFQLPPQFVKDSTRLDSFLKSVPNGIRSAFEFRHSSWFDEDVYSTLRRHKAVLCIAENEELATPPVATADFGYLRLRREDYTTRDIQRWSRFVQEQTKWKAAYVYFKHEEKAVGPKFAAQMLKLLGRKSP